LDPSFSEEEEELEVPEGPASCWEEEEEPCDDDDGGVVDDDVDDACSADAAVGPLAGPAAVDAVVVVEALAGSCAANTSLL
jgi:hypothetical protein